MIQPGIKDLNICHLENWQMKNNIQKPTNFTMTIIKRPITKWNSFLFKKTHNNGRRTVSNIPTHRNVQPKQITIAYYKGDQYCKQVSSAKIKI